MNRTDTRIRWLAFLSAVLTAAVAAPCAQAGLLYWDTNGATAGAATSGTANGTWGGASASAFWSPDSTGTVATGTYVANSDVVFSAGNDTTSALITLGTAVAANGLTFKEGTISISGTHTVSVGAGGITVNNGAGPVTMSPLSLTSGNTIINAMSNRIDNLAPTAIADSHIHNDWSDRFARTFGRMQTLLHIRWQEIQCA